MKYRPIIPSGLSQEEYAEYVRKNKEAEAIYVALMATYSRKSKYLLITGEDGYEIVHRIAAKGKLATVTNPKTIADEIGYTYLTYIAAHPKETYKAEFVASLPQGVPDGVLRSSRLSPKLESIFGYK